MSNGVTNGETHSDVVNGAMFQETSAAPTAPTPAPESAEESVPAITEAAAQGDTEMHGTA